MEKLGNEMKHVMLMVLLSLGINMDSLANNTVNIDSEKNEQVIQLIEADNYKKSDKELEILNIYKERLSLLSYKEKQLKIYENSLKTIKAEIDLMHEAVGKQQSAVNEKEINLLKKEFQLKEKERDLSQLEEKLAQVDNMQLIREAAKLSNPTVNTTNSLQVEPSKTDNNTLLLDKPIKEYKKQTRFKNKPRLAINKKASIPINSGLVEMKKDSIEEKKLKEITKE